MADLQYISIKDKTTGNITTYTIDDPDSINSVAYDATNKKITKTVGTTTTDVVTVATLKTDLNYSAADVGAVATAQGTSHAGKFLVVNSQGNVTPVAMTAWEGGSY